MTKDQLEDKLKQLSDGLMIRSESDAPFEVYINEDLPADELTNDIVVKLAGMPANYPLEVVELDYFFRNMTKANESATSEEAQQATRFRQLQQTLQSLLTDVKVYRIGERRITALILGKTQNGHIAGLKTMLVET